MQTVRRARDHARVRQDRSMAVRWTRERRVEHTREVLLDAAEQVFIQRGFAGAALEDIADGAGYTRGAIYSHFGSKEELFLQVNRRSLDRYLAEFAQVIDSFTDLSQTHVNGIADSWRRLVEVDGDQALLGTEFSLFLARNPEARGRVASEREATVQTLASFIADKAEQLGATLAIPAESLARLVMATSDAITIDQQIGGHDLRRAWVDLVVRGSILRSGEQSS